MSRLRRIAAVLAVALSVGCQPPPLAAPGTVPAFRATAAMGRATTKKGVSVDLINLMLIGSRWELAGAFIAAGWIEADPITAGNLLRQGKALFGKAYPTAPFSNLFYLGRKQDLAFQKNSTDIKKRDHLRLWQSDTLNPEGRTVWLCAASRDIGIGFSRYSPTLITHKVETNRDLERDLVVDDLEATTRVRQVYWLPGDPIDEEKPIPVSSDGRTALVDLLPTWSLFGG